MEARLCERLELLESRCRWLAAGLVGLVALMVGGGLVAMAALDDDGAAGSLLDRK